MARVTGNSDVNFSIADDSLASPRRWNPRDDTINR
jgi:hypothetical protein